MPYRLTKIYTRKGDDGYTTLGENRLSKDDVLLETVGTIDELNSAIGVFLSYPIQDKTVINFFTHVQHILFDMGGEMHLPDRIAVTADHVTALEKQLDEWNTTLPPLKEFILPRGHAAVTHCHLARTICRRAERTMVKLHRQVPLHNPQLLRYLNRLSDVLFVAARIIAREDGDKEVLWDHERK